MQEVLPSAQVDAGCAYSRSSSLQHRAFDPHLHFDGIPPAQAESHVRCVQVNNVADVKTHTCSVCELKSVPFAIWRPVCVVRSQVSLSRIIPRDHFERLQLRTWNVVLNHAQNSLSPSGLDC
jgi:hypothetical protein